MFEYLVRFRAMAVEQRREAIIKLGQSDDVKMIPLLEQIATSDPDPSLKTLAAWAIQHLKSLSVASSASPGFTAPPPKATPPPVPPRSQISEPPLDDLLGRAVPKANTTLTGSNAAPPESPGKRTTEQQKRLAKARLDYALSLHTAKQNAKALSVLAEAVAADPSILETPMVQNLAVALTGEPRDRALEITRDKSRDPKVVGRSARPDFKLESSAALFDTVLEIFGLLAVIALIFTIIDVGLIRLFNRAVDAASSGLGQLNTNDPHAVGTVVAQFGEFSALAAASPPLATSYAHFINNPDMATLSAQFQPTPADMFQQISSALQPATATLTVPGAQATALAHVQAAVNQLAIPTPPARTVIGDALRFGIGFWVSLLLGMLTIYIVGSVIGGAGSLLKFTRYMTRAYLGIFGAILVGLALLYVIATRSDIPSDTQVVLGGAAAVLIGVSGVVGFVALVFAVGRGHQFGLLHGFVALIVGLFVFGVLVNMLGIGAALGR